ncbi:MAG: ORF6N domain-containing protein [Alphaproteobacteria bacterium]|nr:ORF6N domain-containing protein [Alphaproteobacteria bacterium]
MMPVESVIRVLRGQKIVLDSDLATLYGVKPIALRQQVKRNRERFPDDFMFRLTEGEVDALVSQFVIPSKGRLGGHLPYAFTQEGIAMLSSVLRAPRAVAMNIMIMRAFVRLRELAVAHKDIADRLAKLERGQQQTASVIEVLVEDIDRLSQDIRWIKNPPLHPKRRIGFHTGGED